MSSEQVGANGQGPPIVRVSTVSLSGFTASFRPNFSAQNMFTLDNL
jgi:hypothetical protein